MSFRVLFVCLLALTVTNFNNCSEVEFSEGDPGNNKGGLDIKEPVDDFVFTEEPADVTPNIIEGGLPGGHFDLDTSSSVYPLGEGRTNKHVHEYDDKHNVTFVDFFNMRESDLDEINDNDLIGNSDRFKLLVGNANLSPGAVLEINGTNVVAKNYISAAQTYTLGAPTVDGDIQITSFKVLFPTDAIKNGGLHDTETSCVRSNDVGQLGEYRNGALTIQAVPANDVNKDAGTGLTSLGSEIFWESTIFWHKDSNCY